MTNRPPVSPGRVSPGIVLSNKHGMILDGIASLFAEHPTVHDIHVHHIVKVAGVARKTFYDLFGSKDDALRQALERAGGDLRRAISKATAPRDSMGLRIEAGLSALCLWMDDNPGAGKLLLIHAPAISFDIHERQQQLFAEMFSTDGLVGPFEEMLVGAVATPLSRLLLAGEQTLPALPDLRDLILGVLQVEESSGGGGLHA